MPNTRLDIFHDNSLERLYAFDGNANDIYNGYNGTIAGIEYAFVDSKFGQGLEIRGSTSRVDIPDFNLSNYTISLWLYVKSYGDKVILGYNDGYACIGMDNTGNLYTSFSTVTNTLTRSPIPLNRYVHVVITSDGTYISCYIDSIPHNRVIGRNTSSYPITAIGNVNDNNKPATDIVIDHVRFFNRILNSKEIQRLYAEYPGYNLLVKTTDNTVYTYDYNTNNLVFVNNLADLTDTDFIENGLISPFDNIPQDQLKTISPFKIITYTNSNVVSPNKVLTKVATKPVMLKSKFSFPLSEVFKAVTDIQYRYDIGVNTIKTVLSPDGRVWFTYNGTSWRIISFSGLDPNDPDDIQNVLNNGIDIATLSSLSLDQIPVNIRNSMYIAFVVDFDNSIEDTAIYYMEITGDGEVIRDVTSYVDSVTQTRNTITINPVPRAKIKILYED